MARRRADAVCRGSQGESARLGIADAAAFEYPLAEDAAEYSHAEDHHRGDGDIAAERSHDRHGDRNGDRFGRDRGEDAALRAEGHGDIDHAQHSGETSGKGGGPDRQEAAAQAFDLFVEQVAERHDRHAEREVENACGLAVAFVADACRAEEDDHRGEREQHGVEQRGPRPAVEDASGAIEADGERQQEEVRAEKVIRHGACV